MAVRNEAWILGLSARVALQWCDEIEVLMHACTDSSMEVLEGVMKEFPQRVTWTLEDGASWDEMAHRDYLLNSARNNRRCTPTHIAIIDADEVLTANLLPIIRTLVERTAPGQILQLPLYNLRGGIGTYHANGLWGNRIVSVAFADEPRLGWTGDKFHAREPVGVPLVPFRPVEQGAGGVMHYWGSSERRLRAKHAMYKVTERLRWPDKPVRDIDRMYSMWRDGVRVGEAEDWTRAALPWEWTGEQYLALMGKHLHNGAEPWQEAEVLRLVAEHGRDKFAGLDLFGVGDAKVPV